MILPKLKNIPHIYYFNLDNRIDRKNYMEGQFKKWGIEKYTRISGSKYLASNVDEWKHLIKGKHENLMPHCAGNSIAHLEFIKKWLKYTNDQYMIIMEDDYDLEIIEYWHFTWEYLMKRLPYDWDCVQLGYESMDKICFFLHPKMRSSFFGPCLINRNYAEKLINLHTVSGGYCFNNPVGDNMFKQSAVTVDYFIGYTGKTYCLPLITTNTELGSTEYDIKIKREHHEKSRDAYYKWWKSQRDQFSLDEFFTYGKENDFLMTINLY